MTRDENGRFARGNGGGPGRPPKQREMDFYRIMVATVTPDDWRGICKTALTQAKRGDAVARKWLTDYLIGPPEQRLDVTTNGETLNKTVFDYSTAIAAIAPRPTSDSESSGEDQSNCDGSAVG